MTACAAFHSLLLLATGLISLPLPGQEEAAKLRWEFAAADTPRCVRVTPPVATAARFTVLWNGVPLGTLDREAAAAPIYLAMPAEEGPFELRLRPLGEEELTARPEVVVVAGCVLKLRLEAEDASFPVPGVVTIESWEGRSLPRLGPPRALGLPTFGPARVLHLGRGDLIVPAGPRLRLLAYSTPLRAVGRQSVRPRAGATLEVRLRLGIDLSPAGLSRLRPDRRPVPSRTVEEALGLELVGVDRPIVHVPEGDLFALGPALLATAGDFVVAGPPGLAGLPHGPHAPATLAAPGQRALHTNGPVLALPTWKRDLLEGRVVGTLVGAAGDDVVGPFELVVYGPDGLLLRAQVRDLESIPLVLRVPSGTRVLLGLVARNFRHVSPLHPRPVAWVRAVAP